MEAKLPFINMQGEAYIAQTPAADPQINQQLHAACDKDLQRMYDCVTLTQWSCCSRRLRSWQWSTSPRPFTLFPCGRNQWICPCIYCQYHMKSWPVQSNSSLLPRWLIILVPIIIRWCIILVSFVIRCCIIFLLPILIRYCIILIPITNFDHVLHYSCTKI